MIKHKKLYKLVNTFTGGEETKRHSILANATQELDKFRRKFHSKPGYDNCSFTMVVVDAAAEWVYHYGQQKYFWMIDGEIAQTYSSEYPISLD